MVTIQPSFVAVDGLGIVEVFVADKDRSQYCTQKERELAVRLCERV